MNLAARPIYMTNRKGRKQARKIGRILRKMLRVFKG